LLPQVLPRYGKGKWPLKSQRAIGKDTFFWQKALWGFFS
jgi:hypothetical protein